MSQRRAHLRIQTNWVSLIDLACLVIGATVGIILRIGPEDMGEYVFNHFTGWLVFFGSIILANYLAGAYGIQYTYSRFNLAVTWLFSLLFALLVLGVTSYAWFQLLLGRGVLAWTIGVYSALSLFLKMLVYRRFFRSEIFQCRTVILGTGEMAGKCRQLVENQWVMPLHKVVAFVRMHENDERAGNPQDQPELIDGIAVINCSYLNIQKVIESLGAHLVLLGLDGHKHSRELYPRLRKLRFSGVEVMTALGATEVYSGKTPLSLLDEEAMLDMTLESSIPISKRSKRLFDLGVGIIFGIISIPIAIIVALVIKLFALRSPVLHVQDRVGQFGKVFRIYKFRTMKEGAEDDTGPVWAGIDDPRITRIGWLLRKTRLDEIPQFVNVLMGNMSIVGPRPERPVLVTELEKQVPFYGERSNVLPGLTGWAQIRYPYGDSVEDTIRKLEFDLYYIKHMSLSMDLQILLSTFRIMFFGKERKV